MSELTFIFPSGTFKTLVFLKWIHLVHQEKQKKNKEENKEENKKGKRRRKNRGKWGKRKKLLFVPPYLRSQFCVTLWKLIFWYLSSQINADGINFETLKKFSIYVSWKIVGQKTRKWLINNKHNVACLIITKE